MKDYPYLQVLTWKNIRDEVAQADEELAKEIDNFSPSDQYKLYKVRYPWGEHLLKGGMLKIPNQSGTLVDIVDSSIPNEQKEDLYYSKNMPVGIVLNGTLELYIHINNRTIPFVSMKKGHVYGLWVALQPLETSSHRKTSNIVAGSRSLMMIPKIGNELGYKRLQKTFSLGANRVRSVDDQWSLLYDLACHKEFPQNWYVDVLYFSRAWVESSDSLEWQLLKAFFLEKAWRNMTYYRNQVVHDIIFSFALEEKNVSTNPFLIDTVKHLYALGQNAYPGFEFATDSTSLPLDGFQTVFNDVYGMKYVPTIIQPAYLSGEHKRPIYYSLEVPTLMSFSPKSRKANNKLENLRTVQHIMNKTLEYVRESSVSLQDTPIFRMSEDVEFRYFHSEIDQLNEIEQTKALIEYDQNLLKQLEKFPEQPFCENSPFLRGCISIFDDG